jgi:hypothetical protein
MMGARYNLTVETFEEGGDRPVVTHHGETPEQAEVFYQAHLKSDAFLRDCTEGHFGDMPCRNVILPLQKARWSCSDPKTQAVRVADVAIVGPAMVAAAALLPRKHRWLALPLGVMGVLTMGYNYRNHRIVARRA